uniref:DNA polymerase n=1 Tax=viral metagenome TaxID=1070528 RepID=A0A6C0C8E3_9ZZZZ
MKKIWHLKIYIALYIHRMSNKSPQKNSSRFSGSKTASKKVNKSTSPKKIKKVIVDEEPKKEIIDEKLRERISKLQFQIIDWHTYHEIDEDNEEVYVIQLFGRTIDDKDVCLRITNFQPYFFIRIPDQWSNNEVEIFLEFLKNKVTYKTKNNPKYDYDYGESLLDKKVVKRHDFYGFAGKTKFKFLKLYFKSHTAMKEYSYALSYPLKINGLGREAIQYFRYESNLEPHIRFMHINNLSSCGWVIINGKKLTHIPKHSHCDLSYEVGWKDVLPAGEEFENTMAPFKIMGYDIECISCDHNFPQAKRKTDKIIQIGMTVYRYGSMICADQHILVVKNCSKIVGANVECFNSEKALLRAFARKFSEIRPDFMAGYNNFGFDDSYIYDRVLRIDQEAAIKKRVKVADLYPKFATEFLTLMGKLKNENIINKEGISKSLTIFEKKNLSSSALGDNELSFFHVPGIISMDVMKIIMRDHKLTGYKLDNVSANFITEGVKKINFENEIVSIFTNSTKALDIGSYIQIMINDGYASTPLRENAKYKVTDISQVKDGEITFQSIKTVMDSNDVKELKESMANPLLKTFWTFAKDDMHHTNINKYFNQGNPKKIRQIAKYCLKDCKLVNLLLAKLEIVINNIGMAKVCNVPLSYLFLRGQGVKVFSLVSKECRLHGYLIPVLQRKNKDVDGDSDEKYEGATVIKPIPGVYTQPIGVLDFNSLYPNSICEGNMSQETSVTNPKYSDLPGYKYRKIPVIKKDKKGRVIKDENNQPVTDIHCFAEEIAPEGSPRKYGILPLILTKLLNARAATNNKLKTEKDPSVKIALNGLQLAYKITANSLYGQTGAPTSPIYYLPIAASTTSIGRERLYSARTIVEENFEGSKIIYGDSVTGDTPIVYRNVDNDDVNISMIEELSGTWEAYDQFKADESNRIEKEQLILDIEVWTSNGWSKVNRIIRHKTIKQIHRILTPTGCVDVTEDHSLLDKNKKIIKPHDCKIGTELLHGFMEPNNKYSNISLEKAFELGSSVARVPHEILNSDLEIKKSFLDGYIAANGINMIKGIVMNDKVNAQCLYFLMRSIGLNVSINYDDDIYNFDNESLIPHAVTKTEIVKNITYDDYVYDLETKDGTFHAGIGEMILKNTDSIFIDFGLKDEDGKPKSDKAALQETINLSIKAAEKINSIVPPPQRIVYEKTMHPFILITKKKYVGLLYAHDIEKCYLMSMGIVLKRRDNAPIVKIIVGGIIDQIVKTKDITCALEFAKTVLRKLMDGKYSIDKFILSKALKARYKKPGSIAHRVLADRMGARDPGNKPQVNDRIQYVYIVKDIGRQKKKDIKQGELIENPEYVIKNNLKIDYLYYLEHQIINPASQILELMMRPKKVEKFFNVYIIEEQNKRKNRQSMEKWLDMSKSFNDPENYESYF